MSALGPLSHHMLFHIALMTVLAPALVWLARPELSGKWSATWPFATAIQAALLWFWHLPFALAAAFAHPAVMTLMAASLGLSALWFWMAIAAMAPARRWRGVLACLVTGKLFCLLGALLVFAPEALYGGIGHPPGGTITRADQNLAGALMLIACPLTYVLAGIVLALRWFGALEQARTGEPAS